MTKIIALRGTLKKIGCIVENTNSRCVNVSTLVTAFVIRKGGVLLVLCLCWKLYSNFALYSVIYMISVFLYAMLLTNGLWLFKLPETLVLKMGLMV